VWPVDGGAPIVSKVLAPYRARGAQWSPDGTRIAIGQYYEARTPDDGCCGTTLVLRFDAPQRSLQLEPASSSSAWIPGTAPWFGRDGALHLADDPSLACSGAMDIDSSFRWALGARGPGGCSGAVTDLTSWPTATGPQSARPLGLKLPPGFDGAAW
jgi:hypothetical protein